MLDTSPIDLLDRALSQATRLVTGIQPAQLDRSTPCSEWSVRDLLRHMVGGVRSFSGVVRGEPMQSFDITLDDAHLVSGYRDGAAALIAAWKEEGALDRTMTMFGGEVPAIVPLSLEITETALHSWDLMTATDQSMALDEEIAEFALSFTQRNMKAEQRGKSFGPEREPAPGADAYARLAAFSGRELQPVA